MKKLSIVLLALLFVTGTAFAAFDISVGGKASASYTLNLDETSFWYDVDDGDVDFDLGITLATGAAKSAGEGGVYAVIEASAKLYIDTDFTEVFNDGAGEDETVYGISADTSLDVLRIFAGDFMVDFLGYPDEFTSAKSWVLDDDDAAYDFVKPGFESGSGISISYKPLGATVGFNLFNVASDDGDPDPGDDELQDDLYYRVYGGWAGELAEGLDVSLMAGIEGDESEYKGFGASVSASYAIDMVDFSVALDMVTGDDFAMDAALNAVVDLDVVKPAIDVYFAHNFDYKTAEGDNDIRMYEAGNLDDTDLAGLTDLWIRAKVSDFDLGFGMLDFSVFGESMLEGYWFYGADAKVALADLPVVVGVNGGIGADTTYVFGGEASYTYEGIKLYGEGSLEKYYDSAWKVPMKFGVSSSALVDNAVLDLNWDTDNVRDSKGAITASVTVSF